MQIYFHRLLWPYLPRVPTILTTCVSGPQVRMHGQNNCENKFRARICVPTWLIAVDAQLSF